jgi:hypothetical protein
MILIPHGRNPTYISPTDNLMTPCTQKLTAAKKKHFTKFVHHPALCRSSPLTPVCRGTKPIQLFAQTEEQADESDDESREKDQTQPQLAMDVDDENPF